MKLSKLYQQSLQEQVVGHWRVPKGPYEFYGDPKNKRKTDDLSFRLKGKKKISNPDKEDAEGEDPEGGEDKTQALETGATPLGHGKNKTKEIGMRGQPGDPRGGSEMDTLHGSGRVAGGELKAWQGNQSKSTKSNPKIVAGMVKRKRKAR